MNRETTIWFGIIGILATISAVVWFLRVQEPQERDEANRPPDVATRGSDWSPPSDNQHPENSEPDLPIAPVMESVPEFTLTNQAGKRFGSEQLEGTVWVANFIFTRCQATCPAQTSQMRGLQQLLEQSPSGSRVKLLSITVDPEYDSPEVLKDYAVNADADTYQWTFLTGDRDDIWKLSKEGFRLPVTDDTRNSAAPILHDSKFVLVDRSGRIRGYHDVLQDQGMKRLVQAIDFVLPEMAISKEASAGRANQTDLAQPPEIIDIDWFEDRTQAQQEASKSWSAFHDFRFQGIAAQDIGIDFQPQIVDEQRWRLQVNHYDHGNGIAVADVDGDGRLDIYFVSQAGSNGLYRNLGGGKFENITQPSGVGVEDRIGVTASFADVDNDGDADLFVTTVRGGNILFENDGTGVFQDITEQAGVAYSGHSSSAVFFDYDRDGLLDLFLCNVGKYTTEEFASLRLDPTSSLPPGDYKYYVGTKDAFAGHLKPGHGETSILYKNLGNRKFEDVTESVGLNDDSWSGAATPLDVNQDGWPDLYLLNMQGDDQYYENQQGERFERKSRRVFPRTPWGSMGAKAFDYNNNGHFDLYITDMHSDMSEDVGPELEKRKSNMQWPESFLQSTADKSIFGNAFFEKRATGGFQEVSDEIGAENYWPWGLSVGDLNADGFDDVFVASSMCFPYRYGANSVLLNDAGQQLVDSEFLLGVEPRPEGQRIKPWFQLDCDGQDQDHPICIGRSGLVTVWSALGSRSSVLFDIDEDGDLDIVTNDFNSPPLVLISDLADKKQPLNWIQVALQGSISNRDALGAMVTVKTKDRTLYKVHDGQSGYLSQSRKPLYFGLGDAQEVSSISIQWPSGIPQELEGPLTSNQTIKVVEPEG